MTDYILYPASLYLKVKFFLQFFVKTSDWRLQLLFFFSFQVLFKHLQEKLLLTEVCYPGMGLSGVKSQCLLYFRLQFFS